MRLSIINQSMSQLKGHLSKAMIASNLDSRFFKEYFWTHNGSFYGFLQCIFVPFSVMSISSKVSSELFALKGRSCYTQSSKVIDINSGCLRVCIQSSFEDDR